MDGTEKRLLYNALWNWRYLLAERGRVRMDINSTYSWAFTIVWGEKRYWEEHLVHSHPPDFKEIARIRDKMNVILLCRNDNMACNGLYDTAKVVRWTDDSALYRHKCSNCGHTWDRIVPNQLFDAL